MKKLKPTTDPEEALKRFREQRKAYKKALAKWDKKLASEIEAIRNSQRITADDLKIIVY